jgi:hypothetical protein
VREEDCRVTAKRNPARRTDIRSKPRKLSGLGLVSIGFISIKGQG